MSIPLPANPRTDAVSENDTAGKVATFLVVVATTVFVIIQLRPGLLFNPNMDVGGDNAAHVVAANYLIHNLLPHGQISGWDPEWFDGFPLYVFYFPLPAVIISILNVAFSYAVAFKLVTVLGSVLMPVAAYAFGRLAGFSRPVPALMSAAMLAFLFNTSYTIDGGNLPSTLAGEFSFTLSMVFGLLFLGVVAYAFRTGRLRWLAPILFAATALCHVVPAICVAGGAIVLWAFQRSRMRTIQILVPVGLVGFLLASFWLLRFGADLQYSSSMGYSRVVQFWHNMFPSSGMIVIPILAIVGAIFAAFRGNRTATALAVMVVGSSIGFAILPSGLVYNGRWLPFYFLSASLLAAYAVSEVGRAFFASFGFASLNTWLTTAIGGLAALAVVAAYVGVLPGFRSEPPRSFIPGWVAWNYTGYQAKPGWSNFEQLIAMMMQQAKVHGCGRLDYEYSPNFQAAYGSTLVPMSFPLWTNGCIQSVEGLYYESSTTTPFHFLDQALLSISPSNPVVGIPYKSLDVPLGIRDLQETGVQYFLANSAEVEATANADLNLVKLASIPAPADAVEGPTGTTTAHPQWVMYEVKNSAEVAPLSYEPVVESGMSKTTWLSTAIAWYQNPTYWSVPIVSSGPSSWPKLAPTLLEPPDRAVSVKPTSVSNITTTNSGISFDVTKLGSPVLVKVPYFPNWQVTGATGPYASTPNLMIVVPTAHHVVLHYGTTTVDWVGRALSVVGLAGVVALRGPVAPDPAPFEAPPVWLGKRRARRARRRHAPGAAKRTTMAPPPAIVPEVPATMLGAMSVDGADRSRTTTPAPEPFLLGGRSFAPPTRSRPIGVVGGDSPSSGASAPDNLHNAPFQTMALHVAPTEPSLPDGRPQTVAPNSPGGVPLPSELATRDWNPLAIRHRINTSELSDQSDVIHGVGPIPADGSQRKLDPPANSDRVQEEDQ